MKRVALLTVLLAGAGFSALALDGCSGPTAPTGDAGFFGTTPVWGTGGAPGTGGSFGTGGFSGTGGSFGGNPGGEQEDGGRRDRRQDAAPLAACPAGAMDDAPCTMGAATCWTGGDGGRGEICTCRERRGEGTWRCETP
jgi:hypothetical protein